MGTQTVNQRLGETAGLVGPVPRSGLGVEVFLGYINKCLMPALISHAGLSTAPALCFDSASTDSVPTHVSLS